MSGVVVVVVVVVSGQPVSSVDPISIPTSFACVCVFSEKEMYFSRMQITHSAAG